MSAYPHRTDCQCGGTGVIEGEPVINSGRAYRQVLDCPGQAWPTPAPTRARARETGRPGVAKARAVLDEILEESREQIGGLL